VVPVEPKDHLKKTRLLKIANVSNGVIDKDSRSFTKEHHPKVIFLNRFIFGFEISKRK